MAIEVDGEIYEWLSLAKGAAVEVEPTEVVVADPIEEWIHFAKGDQHTVEVVEETEAEIVGKTVAEIVQDTFETLRDALVTGVGKRAFSDEHRAEAAKKGVAMPDGGYPIETPKDLENATADYKMGRVAEGQKAAVMAHIINRASDIGEPNPFEQEDESDEDSSASDTTKAIGEPTETSVEETTAEAATRQVDLETFYYSKSEEGDDPADADGGEGDDAPDGEVEKTADETVDAAEAEAVEEAVAPEGDVI